MQLAQLLPNDRKKWDVNADLGPTQKIAGADLIRSRAGVMGN